jgi:hypothetical protein
MLTSLHFLNDELLLYIYLDIWMYKTLKPSSSDNSKIVSEDGIFTLIRN